jgi:hypothetical protein
LVGALPSLLEKEKDLHMIFNFIPAKRDDYIKEKLQNILRKLPSKEK